MIVVGLDTASDRWHAVLDTGAKVVPMKYATPPHTRKANARYKNPDVRRLELAKTFCAYLQTVELQADGEVFHIFAEEPLALTSGSTTRLLGLAAGALWSQYIDRHAYWHWVDVGSWQAMVGVKSSMRTPERKELAKAYTLAHIGPGVYEDWDEDHFDAYCVKEYGKRWLTTWLAQTTG